MKTQIIQLEPNEDVISIRDKLNWNQARRILLVWPRDGHPFTRKLDLNLIARHAASLGIQLALLTQDPQVISTAGLLGIPVFAGARQAQYVQWVDTPKLSIGLKKRSNSDLLSLRQAIHPNPMTWLEHRATKILCLSVSVLALFSLAIFILPSAIINISPHTDNQSMVFELVADPQAHSINYSTGSLPAYTQEVIIEERDSSAANGSVRIPAEAASGVLRFTNESDRPITIPIGTIVMTSGGDPVRFITTSSTETSLDAYETIDLPAKAMYPGLSGNLDAFTLEKIEGDLGQDLSVMNPGEMMGGTEAEVPSPTKQDLADLRQRLTHEMIQEALVQLQSSIPNGDILLSSTLSVTEILDETAYPPLGEPGNDLELSMRIGVAGQAISRATLLDLVIPIMNSYTPSGYLPLNSTLEISPLKTTTVGEDGKTHWTIRVTRQVQADIQPGQIASLVNGKTVSQATQKLFTTLPLAKQPDIVLKPTWWPRLPFLAMRIQVWQAESQ